MADARVDELARRVARLERAVRRWRVTAVVAGGVLALAGLVGATTAGPALVADEVRARRFVLVDEAGSERGWLDTPSAIPSLTLSSEGGRHVRLSSYALDMSHGESRAEVGPNTGFRVMDAGGIVRLDSAAFGMSRLRGWAVEVRSEGPSIVLRGARPRLALTDASGLNVLFQAP